MPRCPHCRTALYASREELGARCSYCREPLYERIIDEEREERLAAGRRCAAHPGNPAQATCQRCGNYMCWVCRTRWQDKAWCMACVARALEAGDRDEVGRFMRASFEGARDQLEICSPPMLAMMDAMLADLDDIGRAMLDVAFGEDDSRTRAGHAAANLGMLRRVAVSLLKRAGAKGSIQTRRMKAAWDDEFLLKVLQEIPAV